MLFIRTADVKDAKAIAELHARSWQENYRGLLSDDYLDHHVLNDRNHLWQNRLSQPQTNQIIFLAFAEQSSTELLGFICVFGEFNSTWGTLIDNLHVRKAQKGLGIGRTLMAKAAEWSLRHYPTAGIHLDVLIGNIPAMQFYLHLGGVDVEGKIWLPTFGGEVPERIVFWRDPHLLILDEPSRI